MGSQCQCHHQNGTRCITFSEQSRPSRRREDRAGHRLKRCPDREDCEQDDRPHRSSGKRHGQGAQRDRGASKIKSRPSSKLGVLRPTAPRQRTTILILRRPVVLFSAPLLTAGIFRLVFFHILH